MRISDWSSDVCSSDLIRRAKVARVSSLSPHMRRIVVSGAELNGFFSPGFDDHVKLFMPAPGAALVLPSVGERGMEFPTDGARPVARDFTPRHFDHARKIGRAHV